MWVIFSSLKTSHQCSAGGLMFRLSLSVGCHCAAAWEQSAGVVKGCSMCVREHTLPILKAKVLLVWVQRTGLYKHNVSGRTDRPRKKKSMSTEEDRSFFVVYSKSQSTALGACEHTEEICIYTNWVAPHSWHKHNTILLYNGKEHKLFLYF